MTLLVAPYLLAQSPSDALALEQQGKFAEAAEAWRAVVVRDPKDAGAFASLGLDLARLEKYAEAVHACASLYCFLLREYRSQIEVSNAICALDFH